MRVGNIHLSYGSAYCSYPNNKIDFFIDLATNLGFRIENNLQKNVLTQMQIELVEKARKNIKDNPESFLDWKKHVKP